MRIPIILLIFIATFLTGCANHLRTETLNDPKKISSEPSLESAKVESPITPRKNLDDLASSFDDDFGPEISSASELIPVGNKAMSEWVNLSFHEVPGFPASEGDRSVDLNAESSSKAGNGAAQPSDSS